MPGTYEEPILLHPATGEVSTLMGTVPPDRVLLSICLDNRPLLQVLQFPAADHSTSQHLQPPLQGMHGAPDRRRQGSASDVP